MKGISEECYDQCQTVWGNIIEHREGMRTCLTVYFGQKFQGHNKPFLKKPC